MLSHIEEEFETFTRERSWKLVFDQIQNEACMLHNNSVKNARLAENRDRNRYRDVSPYDDHSVRLEGLENNYINASYVQVPLAKRKYILTQGPLSNTVGHFWLMVWQQNSKGIVMLNRIVEDGRLKCHPYFPLGAEAGQESFTFDNVNIRVEHIDQEDYDYFLIRKLKMVHLKTGEEKSILQFHYMDWPDFGIPQNSESFLSFLYAVRQSGSIPSPDSTDTGPPIIHCSAGIGRSGTFCLVDSALVLVERTKSLNTLDIRHLLVDMRKYRCGLIQRPEQLKFSYMAILDGAQSILAKGEDDDSHPVGSDDSGANSDVSSTGNISDDEADKDEAVNTNQNAATDVLNHKDISANGPDPPARTSSLSDPSDLPPAKPPRVVEEEPPPKAPRTEVTQSTLSEPVPAPPLRTTSLHRQAISLDQDQPPPVPPRPPGPGIKRQISAPPSPESKTKEKKLDESEEEEGYENQSNSPIKKKREEQKKKTQAMVDSMRAKQKAAEAENESPGLFSSHGLLIGAGIAVVLAVGAMYVGGYII